MLNAMLKWITGKEVILYNPHRNSNPLVNLENRKRFIFIPFGTIWKATGIFGRNSRLRYRVMSLALSVINPVYIIDINWITKKHTLFRLWALNHGREFVVVQHGAYHGGTLRDIKEKYINCTLFLAWSDYFKELSERNNPGKEFKAIAFGNPCYNRFDRSQFSYPEAAGNRILVAVSLIKGGRLEKLRQMVSRLRNLGFKVSVKEHNLQSRYSEPIEETGEHTLSQDQSLYTLLKGQEYDMIISDVSSSVLDAIFFKNRVIYFSPSDVNSRINENMYSEYLDNLAENPDLPESRDQVLQAIHLQAQEELLGCLIKTRKTSNDLEQIEKILAEQVPDDPALRQARRNNKLFETEIIEGESIPLDSKTGGGL